MPQTERRTAIPAATKRAVYEDAYVWGSKKPEKYRCALCGKEFPKADMEIDHIKAWADGGTHERGNLRLLDAKGKASCHRRVSRKQASARQRAPKSRAHLWSRIIGSSLAVVGFLSLLWAATHLVGTPEQEDQLLSTYKAAGGALAVAFVLLGVACKVRAKRPSEEPSSEVSRTEVERVQAWISKAIPNSTVMVTAGTKNAPTIAVKYPPHTPTSAGTFWNDLQDKAEDMYPKACIAIDKSTGKDTFTISDTPDPLNVTVEAQPLEEVEREANYASVDIGITDDGKRWRLPVLGSHMLVGGQSGSGKSISFWGIIRGLAPGIRDGLVRIYAIDPKGGVELGPGLPLFHAYSDGEETKNTIIEPLDTKLGPTPMDAHLSVLNAACSALRERLKNMKADGLRKIETPCSKYPLTIVAIDEAAFVLEYASDAKAKKSAQNALEVLTSQGRAAGFVVICLVQDPSAQVTKIRNLLPRRLALRVDNPTEVRMLLGDGSVAAGARAHKIPRTMPGTGYTLTEEDNRPRRFRCAYVSDAEVLMLARDYAPRQVTLVK